VGYFTVFQNKEACGQWRSVWHFCPSPMFLSKDRGPEPTFHSIFTRKHRTSVDMSNTPPLSLCFLILELRKVAYLSGEPFIALLSAPFFCALTIGRCPTIWVYSKPHQNVLAGGLFCRSITMEQRFITSTPSGWSSWWVASPTLLSPSGATSGSRQLNQRQNQQSEEVEAMEAFSCRWRKPLTAVNYRRRKIV